MWDWCYLASGCGCGGERECGDSCLRGLSGVKIKVLCFCFKFLRNKYIAYEINVHFISMIEIELSLATYASLIATDTERSGTSSSPQHYLENCWNFRFSSRNKKKCFSLTLYIIDTRYEPARLGHCALWRITSQSFQKILTWNFVTNWKPVLKFSYQVSKANFWFVMKL